MVGKRRWKEVQAGIIARCASSSFQGGKRESRPEGQEVHRAPPAARVHNLSVREGTLPPSVHEGRFSTKASPSTRCNDLSMATTYEAQAGKIQILIGGIACESVMQQGAGRAGRDASPVGRGKDVNTPLWVEVEVVERFKEEGYEGKSSRGKAGNCTPGQQFHDAI